MKNKNSYIFLGTAAMLLAQLFCLVPAPAQNTSPDSSAQNQPSITDQEAADEQDVPTGVVVIAGRPVLTVYEPVGALSPQERADKIRDRIIAVAKDRTASPDSIRIQPRDGWTEIIIGDKVLMAVTEKDATMSRRLRPQLASDDADSIRQAILSYRHEHTWTSISQAIVYTLVSTLVLALILWIAWRMRIALRSRIESRIKASAQLAKKSAWDVSLAYLGPISLALGTLLRWVFLLVIFEAYLTVTLGFFPQTRYISLGVTNWVFSQLTGLTRAALDYLPNLLILGAIALLVYYLLRLLKLIFGEIGKGAWEIRNFYPDWADPTEKLLRMLVLILALIVTFPYMPGAKSPAFRGISIFVGVLLSLGSSSAVANFVAGIILTYMRSFLVGDWVQIGDTTGEVVETTVLVTRILTPKAEVVTIPNATVMAASVRNYSTEARKSGVIFHTTVTIGYDAPWRTVNQLLLGAALATPHVLKRPAPFVLQSALNDFFVSYELNAYTDTPREMLNIFSALHQNIQDRFNEAGVEICSPHFAALRDANTIAIPSQYIPPDYKAPGFRIDTMQATENGAYMPKETTDPTAVKQTASSDQHADIA